MMEFKIIIILFFFISLEIRPFQLSCPELIIKSRSICVCDSTISNVSIEYFIECEQYSLNSSSPSISLVEVKPVSENQLDLTIQSLSIANQQIGELNIHVIDATMRLIELNLINDSIESISPISLSNLVDLVSLTINGNSIRNLDLSILSQLDHLEILNLTGNGLESINLSIGKTMNVLKLYLDHNKLVTLGDFRDFPNLNILSITNNLIEKISNSTFANLTQLQALDLKYNMISQIEPNSFASLASIRRLYLDHNRLTWIDSSLLTGLSQLIEIQLRYNRIVNILSNSFVLLEGLSVLDFSGQNIMSIEFGSISKCEQLTKIYLYNNQLRVIVSGFLSDLPSLEYLDLSENLLHALAYDTFGHLISLEKLDLSNNIINSIQDGAFVHLNQLQELYLKFNFLREIISGMFLGLKNLAKLYLDNNKISVISYNAFHNLPNLKTLKLENNFISKIEPFTFSNLKYLTALYFVKNQLDEITQNMFTGLNSLKSLKLENNKIASIKNNSFIDLKSLRYLFLDSNQLKSLEFGVFFGLEVLEFISLSNNQLESINGAFSNLNQLKGIYFTSNKLRWIDNRTFKGIKELKEIEFSGNPLDEYIEKSVFDRFGKSITLLGLSNIEANPSDFINFPLFETLKGLDVSNTRFRIKNDTFKTIANTLWQLNLRRVGMRDLSFLPMDKMIELDTLDLSDNSLDWSAFCNSNASGRFFRENQTLKNVYLSNTSITDLRCLGIDNLAKLSYLDVSNNLIETIESSIFEFSCFRKDDCQLAECFTDLILTNNRIKFIQPNSFDCMYGLFTLQLDGNLITDDQQITNMNFPNLNLLRVLNMSNSNVTHIPLFSSKNNYALKHLILTHNCIESIRSVHFDYLANLRYLDLTKNKISRIDSQNIFFGSPLLQVLNLSLNFIDTSSLRRINLSLCFNLKSLNLSYNRLSSLEKYTLNNLAKLEIIDLSYNNLLSIESFVFNGLSSLKSLYFLQSSYSLAEFQVSFISKCESLTFVYVSSIQLIQSNFKGFTSSLKARPANKTVNYADYYYSINIILDNYDYFRSDTKLACELTISLLSNQIQLNLFDDFGLTNFLNNCLSLDLLENLSP